MYYNNIAYVKEYIITIYIQDFQTISMRLVFKYNEPEVTQIPRNFVRIQNHANQSHAHL